MKIVFQKFLDDVADTRWPWKESQRQIKHLSANDLMRHAISLLNFAGRNQLAGRLVYHAILKDSYQVDALIIMSDFLAAGDSTHFAIDLKPYAAAVLEYALVAKKTTNDAAKSRIQAAKMKLMVKMGYATLKNGKKVLDEKDYLHPDQFNIDELSYIAYVMPSVNEVGSITDTFKLAHAFLGVYAGLLEYKRQNSRTAKITLASFDLSPVYYSWLRSDPDLLVRSYLGRKKQQTAV